MTELTTCERFVRLFNGESVDRVPFMDIMGCWPSAIERWKTEGLAPDATADTVREIIGFDAVRGYFLRINAFVWPHFEQAIVGQVGMMGGINKFALAHGRAAIDKEMEISADVIVGGLPVEC